MTTDESQERIHRLRAHLENQREMVEQAARQQYVNYVSASAGIGKTKYAFKKAREHMGVR